MGSVKTKLEVDGYCILSGFSFFIFHGFSSSLFVLKPSPGFPSTFKHPQSLQSSTRSPPQILTDVSEAAMTVPELEDFIPSMVKKTAGELADMVVEGVAFPSKVALTGSSKELFVGGAGVRGIDIGGHFTAVTAIAIYLESTAVSALAGKWKGKSPEELAASVHFFQDIVTGHFEKLTRVTLILGLTGEQYSEKVVSNCVASWTAAGVYTKEEETATKQFLEAFKPCIFQPTSSIFFAHSPRGPLSDGTVPEAWTAVIHNQKLSNAVLESIIGEHGVSPAAKWSLAQRISELLHGEEEQIAVAFEKRMVGLPLVA